MLAEKIREIFREGFPLGDDVRHYIDSTFSSPTIKELESIIGEESLTSLDRKILNFGKSFEQYFMNQRFNEERDILTTLNLAWGLVSSIPKRNILRVSPEILEKYYVSDSRLREQMWGR